MKISCLTIGAYLCSLTALSLSTAHAVTVDFNTIDSYTADGSRIDRIGDITFSRDIYTNPDGFALYGDFSNNFAYSYYGESGEYLYFDNAVTFQSMDFSGMFLSLPQSTEFVITLLDSMDTTLQSMSLVPSSTQTLIFNQENVSKIVFSFSGGDLLFYGDGRYHAWYTIDNLTYEVSAVPIPSAVWLFGAGLIGLIGIIKKPKQA